MPANTTPVAMDAEKLFRCIQFFINDLLPARGCTYDVQEYQTDFRKFKRYYRAVKGLPDFEKYFHIVGSIPVRKAVRKQFKALTATDIIVPNMPKAMPEDSQVPSVPLDCWPIAVKKAIAKSKGESYDEEGKHSVQDMDEEEKEQLQALEVLAVVKKLPKRKRDELLLILDEEQEKEVQSVFRALGRRRKNIVVSPPGIEAARQLEECIEVEALDESTSSVAGGGAPKKRSNKKKKGPPVVSFPEFQRTEEKLVGGRQKFLVHFLPLPSDISFGKPAAEALIAHMKEHGYTWLFLVTVSGVTPHASRELSVSCGYELWPMRTCLSRINKHYTVPKHRRLTPSEKAAFYRKWRISPAQVPRMLVTDPIARFLSLVPGDVVKIDRSTFVGKLEAYRVVTHGSV